MWQWREGAGKRSSRWSSAVRSILYLLNLWLGFESGIRRPFGPATP